MHAIYKSEMLKLFSLISETRSDIKGPEGPVEILKVSLKKTFKDTEGPGSPVTTVTATTNNL